MTQVAQIFEEEKQQALTQVAQIFEEEKQQVVKKYEEEKQQVRLQIEDYKKYWKLIQDGRYFRLTSPWQQNALTAWEFVNEDGTEALLQAVTTDTMFNPPVHYVFLKGLKEQALYRMEGTDQQYTGGALMHAGIPVPQMKNEYMAWSVHLKEVR